MSVMTVMLIDILVMRYFRTEKIQMKNVIRNMPNLSTDLLEHIIPVRSKPLHETACNVVMKDESVENMVIDDGEQKVSDLLENFMGDSSDYVTLTMFPLPHANQCHTASPVEYAQHDQTYLTALTMSDVTAKCHDIAKRLTDSRLVVTTTEGSSY